MQSQIYSLPEIHFVGGKTQKLRFHLFNDAGAAVQADNVSADFSICEYSNKNGEPILSYTPTLAPDESGITSILSVDIPSEDTATLFGKYVYQIIVVDSRGTVEIPNQGFMYITRNIHQNYLLNSQP